METSYISVENESNFLSFSIQEENGIPWWNCVDHHKTPFYIVSNQCGTCPAIFKLLQEKTSPLLNEDLNRLLNNGLSSTSGLFTQSVSAILPKGKYLVSLQQITPRYSRIHKVDVEYNWVNKLDVPYEDGYLSECIYPIIPEKILDHYRIDHYYHLPYTHPNLHPTAVTLSFVRRRFLSGSGEYLSGRGEYIYIGHILLDGHHKMMAASWRGNSISMLSFWITDSFVSDLKEDSADKFVHSLYPDQ